MTVAAFIAIMSCLTGLVTWLEFERTFAHAAAGAEGAQTSRRFSLLRFFKHKLLLMWATVCVAILGVAGEAALLYNQTVGWETERLTEAMAAANDLNARHAEQVLNQADTVLHAVRAYYLRTGSIQETEQFIRHLPFDKSVVDNVYLISPEGILLISHDPAKLGISLAGRSYISFHTSQSEDVPHVSAVEAGRVTGLAHFRVTRRIHDSNGLMLGIVLATINPEALTNYFTRPLNGTQNLAALLGTSDRQFRAAWPPPTADMWAQPVVSPLWEQLEQAPTGRFRNTAVLDGIDRQFVYQTLTGWPLVATAGFSESDVRGSVYRRLRWPALGLTLVLGSVLALAALLTVELKRRQEQDNFMAMLSHELKTPLSVLRMTLGNPKSLTDRTREHALQAVQDMDTIVYRCLQADRLKHPDTPVLSQSCHVADVLADLHAAHGDTGRLHTATAADLPTLQTDPQLLSIALNNLVDNALKYALPLSPIHITAQQHIHQRQPGVLVTVSNTEGPSGRPDAQWVFQKYHRGARAHSKTGSGLGLYLVHTVAKLLGGWARYAPSDQLVTFELWLPAKR